MTLVTFIIKPVLECYVEFGKINSISNISRVNEILSCSKTYVLKSMYRM